MIKKQRKTIRLKKYDYAQPGWYYITVCAQNRECLFGDIVNEKMKLNNIGKMIGQWYSKIPKRFDNVGLDEYQIMPNHLHGIIVIGNTTHREQPVVGVGFPDPQFVGFPDPHNRLLNQNNGRGYRAPTLEQIMAYFKYQSTKQINELQKTPGKRLWQRNYYEHIIRDEKSLEKIRGYINSNSLMWYRDRNNPNKNV